MQVCAQLTRVLAAAGVVLNPDMPADSDTTALPLIGVADEPKNLAGLRDAGVLTDAEFTAQKIKIEGRIWRRWASRD
jgi:hypothetical protein